MKRRVLRLIATAAVVGGVMVPAAALAQEYPSPTTDPTPTTAHTGSQTAATPASPVSTKVQTGTLPFTGGQLAGLTVAGLGAVGVGLVFLRFGRKRARSLF
jgi:hypothetical protein